MSSFITEGENLIHKICTEVKVDGPISYSEFKNNKDFSDLLSYIEREYYFSWALVYSYGSKIISKTILNKLSLYFRYDIYDYYTNIKDDLKIISDTYYYNPLKRGKNVRYEDFLNDYNSINKSWRFGWMINDLKAIGNNNNILYNKSCISVDSLRIGKVKHKMRINNPEIFENHVDPMIIEMLKRAPKNAYKIGKEFFKNHIFKQEIKRNNLLIYLFFVSFFSSKKFYLIINDVDSVVLCEEKYLSECLIGNSTVLYLYPSFPEIYGKIDKNLKNEITILRNKYKEYINNNVYEKDEIELKKQRLIKDLLEFMGHIKNNGNINISFSNSSNYLHMTGEFSNEDINNYEELRAYIGGFGDLGKKRFNDIAVGLKGGKSFYYNDKRTKGKPIEL